MVCEARQAPINIVCVGNALHGDDGLGEVVFDTLSQQALPDGVQLIRMPFMGPDALSCFEGCQRVLVVDALQGFGAPGTVHRLSPEQVAEETSPLSHGVGLGTWLAQLPEWIDDVPQIEVIGVEAASMTPFSPGLSDAVSAAVEQLCATVKDRADHE